MEFELKSLYDGVIAFRLEITPDADREYACEAMELVIRKLRREMQSAATQPPAEGAGDE